MFVNNNRENLRAVFFDTWQKNNNKVPLESLEKQVLSVMLDHPEYHPLLANKDKYLTKDYLPEFGETNPFLHMSMHLSIREQISTNRPFGISIIYQQLLIKNNHDIHHVEHTMLEALAETLWDAQQNNIMPDEQTLLTRLQQL